MNNVVMDQLIAFHKPNKKNAEWEDNGLAYFSNQIPYNRKSLSPSLNMYILLQLTIYMNTHPLEHTYMYVPTELLY